MFARLLPTKVNYTFSPYESGDLYRFSLNSFDQDTLSTRLTTTPSHFHSKQIQYVCYQNGVFCFYDSDYDLLCMIYQESLRFTSVTLVRWFINMGK